MTTMYVSRAGALACTLAFACPATAVTRTAAFRVSATVESSCRTTMPSSATANDLRERLRIACSPNVLYAVSIRADTSRPDRPRVVLITY